MGSKFTIYTIFDLEELKDECINHKLIFKMALGAFLLIKPQKYVFSPEKPKKDFSKNSLINTNGSNFTNYYFFWYRITGRLIL